MSNNLHVLDYYRQMTRTHITAHKYDIPYYVHWNMMTFMLNYETDSSNEQYTVNIPKYFFYYPSKDDRS